MAGTNYHVILFGDPAQLPPVSNTDIFNTIPWVNFRILQLKEIVRAKDATLSSILLKIRDGICDDQVASVLQSRINSVDVKLVDLTRTVIICSRRNEVETINNECLKLIDGEEHQFEATDTDSNGQPLRETDQKQLQHTRCNNFKSWLSYSTTTKSKYFKWPWVNGTLCEVLSLMSNCILVCKLGSPEDRYP